MCANRQGLVVETASGGASNAPAGGGEGDSSLRSRSGGVFDGPSGGEKGGSSLR